MFTRTESDDAFDRRIDDPLVAVVLTAEQHRWRSESEVWAEIAAERRTGNKGGGGDKGLASSLMISNSPYQTCMQHRLHHLVGDSVDIDTGA
ncbi:TPA: hypothetical protein ACK3Q6_003212 [Burkholderia cepacia]|uniref:hypothetical protein n=1 Tax=Burkholderia cepacia TaxID=292 RepID=UPI001CF5B2AD|nr:hypothetical protein [Burkholderia cepacia]MCA8358203.1 hypothetical protein [Burkholderia cepacia]HDR9759535.1 hypothetical protein [Burkholderia cepacia ATCC 25416]HDV6365826.1 hypothetical protein [Burkholderia cepacia]